MGGHVKRPPGRPQLDALARMEALGQAGFTVSVCCGPCGSAAFRWTVQVLSRAGDEFARPFAAESFAHAIEIADLEIAERGWNR
jgi:hypothetical protein